MSRFRAKRFLAATRLLAGVLAGVLLLFEVLAANGEFHQALHQEGKAAPNSCVLCLLAQGHVDSPQVAAPFTSCIRLVFVLPAQIQPIARPDFTYLAAPSRAPPGPRLPSPVWA